MKMEMSPFNLSLYKFSLGKCSSSLVNRALLMLIKSVKKKLKKFKSKKIWRKPKRVLNNQRQDKNKMTWMIKMKKTNNIRKTKRKPRKELAKGEMVLQ